MIYIHIKQQYRSFSLFTSIYDFLQTRPKTAKSQQNYRKYNQMQGFLPSDYHQYHRLQKKRNKDENLKKAEEAEVQQILTEEEQEAEIHKIFMKRYLQHQINVTQLCGTPFDVLLTIKRCTLPCTGNLQEQNSAFRQWLLEYFLEKANINIANGHLTQRIDVGLQDQSPHYNPKALIVFGTDFLATHSVIKMYGHYNATVSWIDSSHCRLVFQTQQQAVQCVTKNLIDNTHPTPVEDSIYANNWTELKGYTLYTFPRRIFTRNITQADEQYIASLQKNSEPYDKYKATLKMLETDLLKDETVRSVFQQKIQENMASKMVGPNLFRKRKQLVAQKMQNDKEQFIKNPVHSKHGRYEQKMLKKLRKPQDLCDERYTLAFYKDYYENSNILQKYEQEKSFRQSEKNSNRSFNSSWKERKYQKTGSYDKDKKKRVYQALRNTPLLRENHRMKEQLLRQEPLNNQILDQSLLEGDNQLELLLQRNREVSEICPLINKPQNQPKQVPKQTKPEIQIPQQQIISNKPLLLQEQCLYEYSKNIQNPDGKAPQSIIPSLSMFSSIPHNSIHELHLENIEFSDILNPNSKKMDLSKCKQKGEGKNADQKNHSSSRQQVEGPKSVSSYYFSSGMNSEVSSSNQGQSRYYAGNNDIKREHEPQELRHEDESLTIMKNRLRELQKQNCLQINIEELPRFKQLKQRYQQQQIAQAKIASNLKLQK